MLRVAFDRQPDLLPYHPSTPLPSDYLEPYWLVCELPVELL